MLPPPPREPEKLLEAIWTLSPAKSGALTASEGNLRLHSAYNPEREAAGAISNSELKDRSSAVFYGFGLGYHVIECAKQFPQKKLIIIEPDVCRFYAALCILDWSPVFNLEKLVLAVGCPEDQIIHLLEDTSTIGGLAGKEAGSGEDSFFFDLAPFTAHAAQYFENIRTIVKRNKRKNEINAATLKKFGRLWCRNSLTNLPQLLLHGALPPNAEKLWASSKPLPFLICGAGPSLQGILPHLKDLKSRALIVCVETALHALQREGLEPDFILLTDPQFWAYRHIAGLSAPESILITDLSAYPAVFRFPCRKLLLCKSQFPVGSWFEEVFGIEAADLGSGGSVASSAWNFARLCGAKEIYTAGLDLGFPEKQTHIKGSSAEENWHRLSNRLSGVEKFIAGSLHSANVEKALDYQDREVLTDSRMKMFAWWFEARLAACPEIKTYTLCPQGLKVPGIKPAPLEQLLSCRDISKEKVAFMQAAEKTKPCLSEKEKAELDAMCDSFPPQEFLDKFSFLKPYL